MPDLCQAVNIGRMKPLTWKSEGDVFNNDNLKKQYESPISESGESVVVAVDGTKEITKHALDWALANVVRYNDKITLLAVIPAWNAQSVSVLGALYTKSSKSGGRRDDRQELECKIREVISCMVQQLRKQIVAKKVVVNVEVIVALTRGVTAREAKRLCATWIVIDRHMKEEGRYCLKESQSNIVIVIPPTPKILRSDSNLSSRSTQSHHTTFNSSNYETQLQSSDARIPLTIVSPSSSSTSSPEPNTSSCSENRDYAVCDFSSVYPVISEMNSAIHNNTKAQNKDTFLDGTPRYALSESCKLSLSTPEKYSRNFRDKSALPRHLSMEVRPTEHNTKKLLGGKMEFLTSPTVKPQSSSLSPPASPSRLQENVPTLRKESLKEGALSASKLASKLITWLPSSQHSRPASFPNKLLPSFLLKDEEQARGRNMKKVSNTKSLAISSHYEESDNIKQFKDNTIRDSRLHFTTQVHPQQPQNAVLEKLSSVISVDAKSLCSVCHQKSPTIGKPPKKFLFKELEIATNSFSQDNFLDEGGFGCVYRGVLLDGQTVAVKQHKLISAHSDKQFCSEVDILMCAQHPNLIRLIGFCIEDKRRLLVYEYVCNGSLDAHLYGHNKPPLKWYARQKIAAGIARGLRYLHEECHVGGIVHRDMRPSNILLTHDFEPKVGDFGLARWQIDGDQAVQTRVIGAFGYLAPEYIQSGQITEKADVYSFGVVLLELISGRKAIDIAQPKGRHSLTEWARPLLAVQLYADLIDPQLKREIRVDDISCMSRAASLCIRQDPDSRPNMSQVLRVLEGDMTIFPLTSSDDSQVNLKPSNIPSPSETRKLYRRSLSDNGRKNRTNQPAPGGTPRRKASTPPAKTRERSS